MTGAWGFLGRAVAARLDEDGWDVVRAGRPQVELPSSEFDDLLAAHVPDLVVHAAGPASVPASVAHPEGDRRGSVDVVRALAESIRERVPRARLLLISSAAVYGEPARLPVTEDAPLAPLSPYGVHRVECERVLRELTERHGVPTAALRVFSAYGEGLRRQVMWDVCTRVLRNREVVLEGTGQESRDFVHASDVAAAAALVAERGSFSAEAYNVGTGVETTVGDLAAALVDELEPGTPIRFAGTARAGDPQHWRADIARIASLGYRQTVELADGARAFARWARREIVGG